MKRREWRSAWGRRERERERGRERKTERDRAHARGRVHEKALWLLLLYVFSGLGQTVLQLLGKSVLQLHFI